MQVGSRVSQGPNEGDVPKHSGVVCGVKVTGLPCSSLRFQPVSGELPRWSHEHDSVTAKQSMRKGC